MRAEIAAKMIESSKVSLDMLIYENDELSFSEKLSQYVGQKIYLKQALNLPKLLIEKTILIATRQQCNHY